MGAIAVNDLVQLHEDDLAGGQSDFKSVLDPSQGLHLKPPADPRRETQAEVQRVRLAREAPECLLQRSLALMPAHRLLAGSKGIPGQDVTVQSAEPEQSVERPGLLHQSREQGLTAGVCQLAEIAWPGK